MLPCSISAREPSFPLGDPRRCSRCSPTFRAARCWWWAAASRHAQGGGTAAGLAQVQIHAHSLDAALSQWLAQGRLRRREGDFDPAWLDEVWLVVAATDDRAFNARLAD